MDNWIDIKELPKESGDVIIQDYDDDVYNVYFFYRGGEDSYFKDCENDEFVEHRKGFIKYWQPLPKAR
jgi:hypothetical protein